MVRFIKAALIGLLLGAALSHVAQAGGTPCGSTVCSTGFTCCFIAVHPFHYACVRGNSCPDF